MVSMCFESDTRLWTGLCGQIHCYSEVTVQLCLSVCVCVCVFVCARVLQSWSQEELDD